MALEIGALSHIFRDIDVLVLSARRPSSAAPPRGPQVGRTFIATTPHHRHIFLRKLLGRTRRYLYIKLSEAHQHGQAMTKRRLILRFLSGPFRPALYYFHFQNYSPPFVVPVYYNGVGSVVHGSELGAAHIGT